MDYIVTFVDDSQALMHWGVKGMHWGVWNAETAAKYGQAGSSGPGGGGGGGDDDEDEVSDEWLKENGLTREQWEKAREEKRQRLAKAQEDGDLGNKLAKTGDKLFSGISSMFNRIGENAQNVANSPLSSMQSAVNNGEKAVKGFFESWPKLNSTLSDTFKEQKQLEKRKQMEQAQAKRESAAQVREQKEEQKRQAISTVKAQVNKFAPNKLTSIAKQAQDKMKNEYKVEKKVENDGRKTTISAMNPERGRYTTTVREKGTGILGTDHTTTYGDSNSDWVYDKRTGDYVHPSDLNKKNRKTLGRL